MEGEWGAWVWMSRLRPSRLSSTGPDRSSRALPMWRCRLQHMVLLIKAAHSRMALQSWAVKASLHTSKVLSKCCVAAILQSILVGERAPTRVVPVIRLWSGSLGSTFSLWAPSIGGARGLNRAGGGKKDILLPVGFWCQPVCLSDDLHQIVAVGSKFQQFWGVLCLPSYVEAPAPCEALFGDGPLRK